MYKFEKFTPETLFKEVEIFSKKNINNKEDFILIFNEGLKDENSESLSSLIFIAKYVRGLRRVLEKGANLPDVNNLEDIKKDLSENIISLLDILKEYNKSMPNKKKEKFEKDYLKMSPYCITNLNSLLEGLEWTKIYLNDLKRK